MSGDPGAGIFQRRHHRGHHHRSVEGLGAAGDRAQHRVHLQGQGDGREGSRPGARRQPRPRRQRAQGRRPGADHRPADRRARPAVTSGPTATTATSPTSSRSRTRFPRRSSRRLRVKLLPEEKKAIETRGTSSVEAYNLYLMARQQWISGSLRRHSPRRDDRPNLQAGGVVRSRLCRGLGADGARPVATCACGMARMSMRFRPPSERCRSIPILPKHIASRRTCWRSRASRRKRIDGGRDGAPPRPRIVGGEPRGGATDVPAGPHPRSAFRISKRPRR